MPAQMRGAHCPAQVLHESAAPHVRGLLTTMIELWETLRHCQPDMYISLNLREPEYSTALRKELREEVRAVQGCHFEDWPR